MKQPKFNFVPERLLTTPVQEAPFRVSIYKQGTLIFPADVTHVYELDGKYIRIYADREKRSIGWAIVKEADALADLKDLRRLKKTPGGVIVVGIRKVLSNMGIEDLGEGWKNLEVSTYVSTFHKDKLYYITLPQKEAKL